MLKQFRQAFNILLCYCALSAFCFRFFIAMLLYDVADIPFRNGVRPPADINAQLIFHGICRLVAYLSEIGVNTVFFA